MEQIIRYDLRPYIFDVSIEQQIEQKSERIATFWQQNSAATEIRSKNWHEQPEQQTWVMCGI